MIIKSFVGNNVKLLDHPSTMSIVGASQISFTVIEDCSSEVKFSFYLEKLNYEKLNNVLLCRDNTIIKDVRMIKCDNRFLQFERCEKGMTIGLVETNSAKDHTLCNWFYLTDEMMHELLMYLEI